MNGTYKASHLTILSETKFSSVEVDALKYPQNTVDKILLQDPISNRVVEEILKDLENALSNCEPIL